MLAQLQAFESDGYLKQLFPTFLDSSGSASYAADLLEQVKELQAQASRHLSTPTEETKNP